MDDRSETAIPQNFSCTAKLSRSRKHRWSLTPLLACGLVFASASAFAEVACKPILSVRQVRDLHGPTEALQSWQWSATVVADARHCATQSGSFEIDFVRIKEFAPDLQFTHKARWRAGEFDLVLEMWADEAILEYRIGFVAPCVCREPPLD